MNYDAIFLSFCCVALFLIGLMAGAGGVVQSSVSHRELIDRGLALYCPQTGEFAFVGECE